ncbi:peptide chain release factor 1 [uncultured Maricaulis sp.]|uniref:peptide chain release factor 1 n=1 Tax=uncultured Maricaulis sp. TaxID=174710 RepID=UPI0030DBBEA6|tara:strand:+ start:3300 stop:4367 length:1068 start_codon:yes stop_codon:yes gene_type:complete
MHTPASRLAQVIDRFDQVEARLGAASDSSEIVKLSKEHAELRPVAEKAKALRAARTELDELAEMMESGDAEMADLAREEFYELKETLPALELEMSLALLPKDKDDAANALIEIRAGTGGDEAALFAGDLYRMYERYAQLQGWSWELASASEGEHGGYKEVIASISGNGVFGRLKFESGVHRVQRVPATESQGRIHTSAATVAIMPQPEDIDIELNMSEIRVDTMRASGAGGQHVNKTDSAVRMTHLPTGIAVVCQEKSQHQNRAKAIELLKAKLYDMQREAANAERAAERKGQIGSGDRSERIRTYNYPQGRVSDHRINLTLYKLDDIVAGDGLDEVVSALIAEDQAARLAALED